MVHILMLTPLATMMRTSDGETETANHVGDEDDGDDGDADDYDDDVDLMLLMR